MGRALVLNATDAPLAVVPARRAVVMVLKEKAEVVLSNGMVFHSEHLVLDAPSDGFHLTLGRLEPGWEPFLI